VPDGEESFERRSASRMLSRRSRSVKEFGHLRDRIVQAWTMQALKGRNSDFAPRRSRGDEAHFWVGSGFREGERSESPHVGCEEGRRFGHSEKGLAERCWNFQSS
jgi:hypothetical protein